MTERQLLASQRTYPVQNALRVQEYLNGFQRALDQIEVQRMARAICPEAVRVVLHADRPDNDQPYDSLDAITLYVAHPEHPDHQVYGVITHAQLLAGLPLDDPQFTNDWEDQLQALQAAPEARLTLDLEYFQDAFMLVSAAFNLPAEGEFLLDEVPVLPDLPEGVDPKQLLLGPTLLDAAERMPDVHAMLEIYQGDDQDACYVDISIPVTAALAELSDEDLIRLIRHDEWACDMAEYVLRRQAMSDGVAAQALAKAGVATTISVSIDENEGTAWLYAYRPAVAGALGLLDTERADMDDPDLAGADDRSDGN